MIKLKKMFPGAVTGKMEIEVNGHELTVTEDAFAVCCMLEKISDQLNDVDDRLCIVQDLICRDMK